MFLFGMKLSECFFYNLLCEAPGQLLSNGHTHAARACQCCHQVLISFYPPSHTPPPIHTQQPPPPSQPHDVNATQCDYHWLPYRRPNDTPTHPKPDQAYQV